MSDQFFYTIGKQRCGPVPLQDLKALAMRGEFKRTERIWKEGMAKWEVATTAPEIFAGVPPDFIEEEPNAISAESPPIPPALTAPPAHAATPTPAPNSVLVAGSTPIPSHPDIWQRPDEEAVKVSDFMKPERAFVKAGWPAGMVLLAIAFLDEFAARSRYDDISVLGAITGCVGGLTLFAMFWAWMRVHYRCWQKVPPGIASTTPGKAVGFLFIPIYGFVWMFFSTHGLAKDMNKTLTVLQSKYRCNEGKALFFTIAWLVCGLLGAVPFLGFFLAIGLYFLWMDFYNDITRAVDVIEAHAPRKT